MSPPRKAQSPREMIERMPLRRTRAELAMWHLQNTSYPHHVMANFVFALCQGIDMADDQLDWMADQARQWERERLNTDFIRYIEAKRQDNQLTILAKRYRFSSDVNYVRDNWQNHEALPAIILQLGSEEPIENPSDLSELIVSTFERHCCGLGKKKNNKPSQLDWYLDRHKLAVEGSQLQDLKIQDDQQQSSRDVVKDTVANSLRKSRFHIALAFESLSCHDQSVKIRLR